MEAVVQEELTAKIVSDTCMGDLLAILRPYGIMGLGGQVAQLKRAASSQPAMEHAPKAPKSSSIQSPSPSPPQALDSSANDLPVQDEDDVGAVQQGVNMDIDDPMPTVQEEVYWNM